MGWVSRDGYKFIKKTRGNIFFLDVGFFLGIYVGYRVSKIWVLFFYVSFFYIVCVYLTGEYVLVVLF